MKPSLAPKKTSHAKARNAALMNLLATPGLGSLLCRRWVAGTGQLLLALAGCALILVWFFREMTSYYGMMFSAGAPNQPNVKILEAGGILLAASWFWSLATSISLLREASRANVQPLKLFAAGEVKLDEAKILTALAALPDWKRGGDIISRTFAFTDFPEAMKFVNAVAELAEQAQHHPDMDVRWNQVTLALTTHSAGGLTEKDFTLARHCDALLRR
jgi:4a-hydroxytetrahydrobiopterin dehydratase